jgi:hypothetical protein
MMSIAVGAIAFCLTVLLVLVLGGILMGRVGLLDGEGLIPTGTAVLFLIAILMGLLAGIVAGIKYYWYTEKTK